MRSIQQFLTYLRTRHYLIHYNFWCLRFQTVLYSSDAADFMQCVDEENAKVAARGSGKSEMTRHQSIRRSINRMLRKFGGRNTDIQYYGQLHTHSGCNYNL